jgi:hypothetical protein
MGNMTKNCPNFEMSLNLVALLASDIRDHHFISNRRSKKGEKLLTNVCIGMHVPGYQDAKA